MKFDFDIESLIGNAVSAALSPESLQPVIEKNVQSAIKLAIDKQFSYDSDFRKALDANIASVMPTDFKDMGRFSDLVLKTVSAYVNKSQSDFVQQAIESKLKGMFKPMPANMKLSELVNMILPMLRENYEAQNQQGPTILVSKSDSHLVAGYWSLYIDPQSDKRQYECAIQAQFDGAGKCFSLKIGSSDLSKVLIIGPAFNVDALMVQLYTGGITIELDQDDFSDVYYFDNED